MAGGCVVKVVLAVDRETAFGKLNEVRLELAAGQLLAG
jgi:hypothetical protein